jgi:hypothetical protein
MYRSLATLDKLVDRFPLPPGAPANGDTSLTHVMRLAAHSITSPTPAAMGQSFIMNDPVYLSYHKKYPGRSFGRIFSFITKKEGQGQFEKVIPAGKSWPTVKGC